MKLRLAAACVALACIHGSDPARGRERPAPAVRLIRVGSDVTLETLDWGGRGPPLVFLAGLGNTAHVFDGFAPQFTDSFHVVGITRRGFGASSGSLPATHPDTLVADIRTIIDTLGLGSVVLVGHSIAGEEMTRFGEIDGVRCAGLVYLDAAYDRTSRLLIDGAPSGPMPPRMRAADAASLATRRAYGTRVMGIREPESEIRATSRFDEQGRYLGEVTSQSSKARIMEAVRVPRYDRVRCPALSIYAVPDSPVDVVPFYAEVDVAGRAQAESLRVFVVTLIAASREAVERFPQNRVVEIRGGNHFIFLQQPNEVARAMRSFLSDTHRAGAP